MAHTSHDDKSLDEKVGDTAHHLDNVHSLDTESANAPAALALDPKDDKRIRRRIDCVIMPVICLVYAMNFVSGW